jgi:predicted aminopeptidase
MSQNAVYLRSDSDMKNKLKYFFLGLAMLLLVLAITFHKLLYYGIKQGYGQISIIMKSKDISLILSDSTVESNIKNRIELVQEIRQFAFDSLGINQSDNYTTYYDQGDKPILWVVSGSLPYKLTPKEWSFPLLGSFSYKGFFDKKMALSEEEALIKEGWETSIGEVEGWSTLGWFKDPILSNMLKRPVGGLANLIIHELTHGTLYVKDNVQYNENLASFVGDKGALRFLEYKYGKESEEYKDYIKRKELWNGYTEIVLDYAHKLDSLYNSFPLDMGESEKKSSKQKMFSQIIPNLKQYLIYYKEKDPAFYSSLDKVNNTYFLDYRKYRQDQSVFENELYRQFNGDFNLYFEYLKSKYPSL